MIKKSKKFWILTITILILIGVYLLYTLSNKKREIRPNLTPTPTSEITGTQKAEFKLEYISPPEGKQEIALTNIAIQFAFNMPVELASVYTDIKPNIRFETATDDSGKILYIRPLIGWKYDTEYTIIVDAKSKDGQSLDSEIKHTFIFTRPTNSPLEEGI